MVFVSKINGWNLACGSGWKEVAGRKWLEGSCWKEVAGRKWLEGSGWQEVADRKCKAAKKQCYQGCLPDSTVHRSAVSEVVLKLRTHTWL
jgi:hypothetical protein